MQDSAMLHRRSVAADLMRGIAAICLIIDHSIISTPVDLSKISWCKWLGDFISIYDLPLFFLVAGYVFNCTSYKNYLLKKLIRIGIPYLFFSSISIVFHCFAGSLLAGGGTTIQEGVVDLIFHGGEYWFLYTIFLIYLVFPLISYFFKNNETLCLFGLLIFVGFASLNVKSNLFLINRILRYLPYFYAGWLLKKKLQGDAAKKSSSLICQ